MEKKRTAGRPKGKAKTGGRKAGTPNKVGARAKDIIVDIVDNNAQRAQEMLDMIVEPKEWLQCYTKLAEFVVPKKASVQVDAEVRKSDFKSEIEEWGDTEL